MKKQLSECNGKAEGLDAGLDPAIGLAESLPEAWIVVPFVRSIDDKRVQIIKVQQAKYKNAGQFPIIDQGQKLIAGYWDDERDVYRGRLPVIVFGDHTRAFKFVDFPFVAGADGTHVLAPCADRFDPYFLYLAFSSLDIPSRGYNRHFRFLKERPVVAPPLPEQRTIAAVLRTVQRAKEACEKVIAATRALKQSLLHHLFTYGPVRFDRADRVVLKETEVGTVPGTWRIGRLGDLVDVKGGKRLPKGSTFSIVPTPYLYIRVVDFENWSVNRANLKFLRQDDHRTIAQYIIRSGDVYISIAGTIGLVGTVPKELDGANLTENAARLVIRRQSELLHDYLVCYLASADGQTAIEVRTVKTSQPKLALARIKDIPVALPTLREQRVIASHLSAVDAKLAAEEKRRAALDYLFQSLLRNLLTGRVRVNHLFDELVGADPRVGTVGGAHGVRPYGGATIERVPDEI